jgi:hypothetical protein
LGVPLATCLPGPEATPIAGSLRWAQCVHTLPLFKPHESKTIGVKDVKSGRFKCLASVVDDPVVMLL